MPHRIYLFNDTSDCHSGSRAVMKALRFRLRQHDVIATHRVGDVAFDAAAFEAADALVVNGEGTIHDGAPAGLFLLDVLRLGQASGKRTLLINALFQETPSVQTRALQHLDLLTVREPRSADWAAACGGRPLLRLDSAADPEFGATGGKRIAALPPVVKSTTHPASPTAGWLDALDVPYFGLEHDFADVVETLKTAELYVTGQHHGVYAAGLAGIPFVALSSNSHKIESLLEWAGLEFALCRSPGELHARMSLARERRPAFERFAEFLRETPVFDESDVDRALAGRPPSPGLNDRDISNAQAFRAAVGGRPLVVLLHGPSLAMFDPGNERLAGMSACVAAVNRFEAIERPLLARTGRRLDVFVATSDGPSVAQSAEIAEFLATDPKRVAIVRASLVERHAFQLARWKPQIVCLPDGPPTMNGLATLLYLNAMTGASPDVFVFGADGADIPRSGRIGLDGARCDERPFRYDEYWGHRLPQLLLETRWLNAFGESLLRIGSSRLSSVPRVHVGNTRSALTAFSRCDIETAIAELSRTR